MPHRHSDLPDASSLPLSVQAAASLPLQGMTLLLVEDSRFASEALRMMCQHAGARLRRADSLAGARAHLKVYRPDLVIADLGLPDGRGEELIAELSARGGPPVLALSGDAAAGPGALRAGARDFMEKPIRDLAEFRHRLIGLTRHHPEGMPRGPAIPTGAGDPLALRDDLIHAERRLGEAPDGEARSYLAGFLSGLARQAGDDGLAAAGAALRSGRAAPDTVAGMLRDRIAGSASFLGLMPQPPRPGS